MRGKLRLGVFCLVFALISGVTFTFLPVASAETSMKCYSDVSEIGNATTMPDVRNSTFKVAVVVENVTNLYGFDIQINWTTQWIHYLTYTVTVSRNSYPNPIPPSPYGGILNGTQFMQLTEVVDENDNISGAETGTMAWIGYSSMNPAPTFNGSGTAFVFTFNVTDQPYDIVEPSGVPLLIHFIATALSDKGGNPITHTREDLAITLYPRKFTYPAVPKIKVSPSFITGYQVNDTFETNITLLGVDDAALDPFWDIAGIEFYLNYNSTYLRAINSTIDPDGTFGAFWSSGAFQLMNDMEPSYVDIAFMGLGQTHTPVSGIIRIATITFNVTYLPNVSPYPIVPINLENPLVPSIWYILDSNSGIIDLSTPVPTEWTSIYPRSSFQYGFNLTDWTDTNGDGKLGVGDQIILLNEATLKTHDYKIDEVKGTIQLTQLYTKFAEDKLAMDGPTNKYTPEPKLIDTLDTDGLGHPDWVGNFSLKYPVASITKFHVIPQIGAEYDLVDGVDFKVNPDGTVELIKPLDEKVINESLGAMPFGANAGWPPTAYILDSFQGVYIVMPNGTSRYANGGIFEEGPPSDANGNNEWWYESWFPYELESWWATGYYPDPQWTWPDGTEVFVNYSAPAFVHIEYNAKPDTQPYFMEWQGDYSEFLALSDLTNTTWMQIHPTYNKIWNVTAWEDVDSSGNLTTGDKLTMTLDTLEAVFEFQGKSTDIKAIELPCVQDVDPNAQFYTNPLIVSIAGFPHPDRLMSPWFGSSYAIPLPNEVENSEFEAIPEFTNLLVALFVTLPFVAVAAKLSRKKRL